MCFDPEPTAPMIIAYLQARGVKLWRDGYLTWQPAEEQVEAALEALRLERAQHERIDIQAGAGGSTPPVALARDLRRRGGEHK